MTSSLDERILAALNGHLAGGGVRDFEAAPSAVTKAQQVLETLSREGFDPAKAVFVNVGGADGTELEYVLGNSDAGYGLLLEYDDQLAGVAIEKAHRLQANLGKRMEVLTGDALQKIEPALKTLDGWREAGVIGAIVLTMHAVLHEFPNRGGGSTDLEGFLYKFLWRRLPLLVIAREPCMPEGLPDKVYLSADCRPDILADLAKRIQDAHPEFRTQAVPAPMAKGVRMGSRIAVETIAKLFYLESLSYEIEERVTSFSKQELIGAFRNVFGTENVHTEAFQTGSVDRFWKDLGITLQDEHHQELAKPEFHVRLVAKWYPPDTIRTSEIPKPDVPTTIGPTPSPGDVRRPMADTPSGSGRRLLNSEDTDSPHADRKMAPVITSMRGSLYTPLDLWTPGPTRKEILEHYESVVGRETAERLWSLSQAAILAVASGDFQRQVEIGRELARIAPENPYLAAEGAYFVGEGLRLLADVERDGARRIDLHRKAMESYTLSADSLPSDPRPLRGIGRILEVQGKYDDALRHLKRAKGLCLTELSSTDPARRPDLAHEMLRTTRHLIHCLLDIRETSPLSQWNRENRRQEIEGLLAECDNYHRDYMPIFEHAGSWSLIEWFMGLVFLGRAWAQLGYPEKAKPSLNFAMDRRRKLITVDGHLSAVERANLRWWLTVASDRTTAFDSRSRELLDRLATTVERGERRAVLQVIDDFLLPTLPPWSHGGVP